MEQVLSASDISHATQKDPVLSRVHDFVMNGWPSLHNQHSGINHMKSFARSCMRGPCLDKQIEQQVAHCETCMAMSNKPPVAPLQP